MWIYLCLNVFLLSWKWNAGLKLSGGKGKDEVYQSFMLCSLLISQKVCPASIFSFFSFFFRSWSIHHVEKLRPAGKQKKKSDCNIVTSIKYVMQINGNFCSAKKELNIFHVYFYRKETWRQPCDYHKPNILESHVHLHYRYTTCYFYIAIPYSSTYKRNSGLHCCVPFCNTASHALGSVVDIDSSMLLLPKLLNQK